MGKYKEPAKDFKKAFETIVALADLDEKEVSLDLLSEEGIEDFKYHKINLLDLEQKGELIPLVKKTIHDLHGFLKKKVEASKPMDREWEGIKSVMAMVGRALDNLKHVHFEVTHTKLDIGNLKEYRKLQQLYEDEILKTESIKEAFNFFKKINISEETEKERRHLSVKNIQIHTIISLEESLSDSSLDLFFIRREDGSHFFNLDLIRNIQLVCDFGADRYKKQIAENFWEAHNVITETVSKIGVEVIHDHIAKLMQKMFAEKSKFKEKELLSFLSSATIALMMASSDRKKQKPIFEYLKDYHLYIRQAAQSYDYQKLVFYPPSERNYLAKTLTDIVEGYCYEFFFKPLPLNVMEGALFDFVPIEKGKHKNSQDIWSWVEDATVYLDGLNHLPLKKVLEEVKDESIEGYDPLKLFPLMGKVGDLLVHNTIIELDLLPQPIFQYDTKDVFVVEEFKAALRHALHEKKHNDILIVNWHDLFSWRDPQRIEALVDLSQEENFTANLHVLSLPLEFSRAVGYEKNGLFVEDFIEAIIKEKQVVCSAFLEELNNNDFYEQILKEVLNSFFKEEKKWNEESLLTLERIFSVALVLKYVEELEPERIIWTGKDIFETANFRLVEFLKYKNFIKKEKKLGLEKAINPLLYFPALFVRHRMPKAKLLNENRAILKRITRNELIL